MPHRPRPQGRCELCGKPIWSRQEVRHDAGVTRHVDCIPGGPFRRYAVRNPPTDAATKRPN